MKTLWIAIFMLALIASAQALDTTIEKIDIEFTVRSATDVHVSLDVTWRTGSSSMAGFYFLMPGDLKRIDLGACYVHINGRDKRAAQITQLRDGQYDIDIENGLRFKGYATYHIEYETEPVVAGLVPLWVSAWDETVEAFCVSVILDWTAESPTSEQVSDLLRASWPAEIVAVTVLTPDGTRKAYRIEEANVLLDQERILILGAEPDPVTPSGST